MTLRKTPTRLVACLAVASVAVWAFSCRDLLDVPVSGAPLAQAAQSGDRLEEAYRLNNLGVALLEQYDYEGAATTFEKALQAAPTLLLPKVNLAIAQLHAGKFAEAAAAAEQARTADPSAPQPHYVLGLVARADSRPEAAAPAFERVLALDPRDLGTLVNLGQLYVQERRYDEAVALFRRAVEAEPYHVTAAYNLSVALTRAGQAEEAERAVARFQQLRESAYGTAFSNNYLERGRYAIALVSTGAESGLVDQATPEVHFTAVDLESAQGSGPAGRGRAAATLADIDRDGDLDLLTAGPSGSTLFTSDGKRLVRAPKDAEPPWPAGPSSAIVVADYDNDHEPDIAVAAEAGLALLRQARPGSFYVTGKDAGLEGVAGASALAFVDADHDGDVDLVVAGVRPVAGSASGSSVRMFRNDGTGRFSDVSVTAGLEATVHDLAIVPTDFDNRRDVDLLLAGKDGSPRLMRNLRDGRFADAATSVGFTAGAGTRAVAAGDVNKDGFTDFFISRDADSRFEMSDGTGRFKAVTGPEGSAGATAVLLLDYDNDGVLDLAAAVGGGVRVWRNLGPRWQDVTDVAVDVALRPQAGGRGSVEALAAGDLDRDGDIDLVTVSTSGAARLLRNDGGNRLASLTVRLTGKVSNMSGVGANVELRAGSLWQKLELTAASPQVAPGGLTFGLGRRSRADVVRVLWPSGVLQAETVEQTVAQAAALPAALEIAELDRKPSSCPLLYTWNGERFEFVTDFLGGGEMGYLHAPGVRNVPDPDEYVRIPGDRLVPRDGRLELRVTNELEETVFLDRLQLIAVTHPAGAAVFPAEGLTSPPFKPFGLYVAPELRPVTRALGDRGEDVLEALRHTDRRFVEGFELEAIRGYAKPHTLTLDLSAPARPPAAPGPAPAGRTLLVLTGWTDYAFSSDNVAAHQAGLKLVPPSLQVRDARGQWQTVIGEIGIPVGRPQSVVVDLTGKFLSASREVRIVTTMRIYWDQAAVDTSGRAEFVTDEEGSGGFFGAIGENLSRPLSPRRALTLTRLEASAADLWWRGFSAEIHQNGLGPLAYDYERVSTETPWKLMPGRYTREGDVRELVGAVDDMFVVSRPGDELRLSFDAARIPPTTAGSSLTYLLYAHGYSKEMDLSSASPDHVAPLPFRGMSRYPYAAPERYPDTPAHRRYLETYNTRVVGRVVQPLATVAGQ